MTDDDRGGRGSRRGRIRPGVIPQLSDGMEVFCGPDLPHDIARTGADAEQPE